jgi:hypothetical protein
MTSRRTFLAACASLVAASSLANEAVDADSIRRAIAQGNVGEALVIPPGTYHVKQPIMVKGGVPVVANECLFLTSFDGPVFELEGGSSVALYDSKQIRK